MAEHTDENLPERPQALLAHFADIFVGAIGEVVVAVLTLGLALRRRPIHLVKRRNSEASP